MAYGWINTAPIRKVETEEEVMAIATKLRDEILGWGAGSETWDPARRHHINKKGAAKMLKSLANYGGQELNYVYEYGGLALGLLAITLSQTTYPNHLVINDLLAHPGTEGGGATLLEYAATVSERNGRHGRLWLYSLNQNATDFYTRMGFVPDGMSGPDGGGEMTLDPAKREDIWAMGNGRQWVVRTYLGKRFAGAQAG
jgi:GNAT superfamily N-acetyltransferase